jgi:hypothetical protein
VVEHRGRWQKPRVYQELAENQRAIKAGAGLNTPRLGPNGNIQMMLVVGGKERSVPEYRQRSQEAAHAAPAL